MQLTDKDMIAAMMFSNIRDKYCNRSPVGNTVGAVSAAYSYAAEFLKGKEIYEYITTHVAIPYDDSSIGRRAYSPEYKQNGVIFEKGSSTNWLDYIVELDNGEVVTCNVGLLYEEDLKV